VLDGNPAPPTERGTAAPHFSAHVCCGQTAGCIRIPLGTEVGLGVGNIVLDGDPAPPTHGKAHSSPHFSAHDYGDQTAAWIWIPLDTEIGLSPGDIVLDGNSQKSSTAALPTFQPSLLWHGRPCLQLLSSC